MKKTKQLSFANYQQNSHKKFFGGALLQGKRKSLRPLTSRDSIHFVLRSSWAKGKDSFLSSRNNKRVKQILSFFADKFGVRIYQQAISGNHIHLLLRITNRKLYRAFIKAVTGKIASQVMGQQSFEIFKKSRTTSMPDRERGDGYADSRFWECRPFSRVVSWGRDFNSCMKYLKQNTLEALGFIEYKARKNYYLNWLKVVPEMDKLLNKGSPK